jgi:hypothetical protein
MKYGYHETEEQKAKSKKQSVEIPGSLTFDLCSLIFDLSESPWSLSNLKC